jgi:hypothetical protein
MLGSLHYEKRTWRRIVTMEEERVVTGGRERPDDHREETRLNIHGFQLYKTVTVNVENRRMRKFGRSVIR